MRPVTLDDWKYILSVMNFYSRNTGYVDFDYRDRFSFFDSDPMINNISALFITKQDVIRYINLY